MASPLTAYSLAADGRVLSYGTTWATVRSGGASLEVVTNAAGEATGAWYNSPTYYVYEIFLTFDTSGIPDDATVTAATLTLNTHAAPVVNDTIYARLRDWGATLTTADYVAADSLSGLTLLASRAFTTADAINTDFALTSEAAFVANINKAGETRILLSSAYVEAGTTPTSAHRTYFHLYESTTQIPKLVVTYTEAATGCPKMTEHYARMRKG